MIYLIVGLAGVFGALARYGIGFLVVHDGVSSIWATLPINLCGCFILAAFNQYTESIRPHTHPWVKAGFGTGFLGAFTTFSTFSLEMVHFLLSSQWEYAVLYFLVSLWGGLAAAGLGFAAVRSMSPSAGPDEGGERA
jgi:fluoride exporter